MPDAPFDPRVILDAAAVAETGLVLHFPGPDGEKDRRDFQVRLSATKRAEQKKLALGVQKWDDLLALTGWEDIVTRSRDGNKLWVGVMSREAFGIGRINGLNGEER